MTIYTPDAWVILRITYKGEVTDKVLAGWYGGYLSGDSWKLNSGITKIEKLENNIVFRIHGHSGSMYDCYESAERMSGYMSGVYASFVKDIENLEDATISVIDIKDILKDYE